MRGILLAAAASFMMSVPAFAGQGSLTPEEMYQPILKQYEDVINTSLNGGAAYELGSIYGLSDYWLNALPGAADVQYTFYDIDQNGIPELFIQNSSDLFDAFGYDGNNIVRLINDGSGRGNRGKMTLYQNGIIETLSYGGQASVYEFYRMSANGYTLEKTDHLYQSFDQCSRNNIQITGYEFQQAVNGYENVPKAQLSWMNLPNVTYKGVLYGDFEKKNGIYWCYAIIVDLEDRFLNLTSGDFYVDTLTKVILESEDNALFPSEGKTAEEWLDDFCARKKYWMTVDVKVKGNHIEEILGIDSID